MIYLDNSATTKPCQAAVAAMTDALTENWANPSALYSFGIDAAHLLRDARTTVAKALGAEPDRVIFTLNTTHALNLLIKGILGRGGHAVCSDMEHNSVYRPLYKLTADGIIDFDVFDTYPTSPERNDDRILSSLVSKIRPDTRLVVCAHASNICSSTLPIAKIGSLCRRMGILFAVDAAQSAGAIPLDMERMNIDALCVPGHKGLMGPQGTGMLILGRGVTPDTLMEGGNGMDSLRGEMGEDTPERFEPGTLQTPAIAGLRAGMEFIRSVGIEAIGAHERELYRHLRDRLLELPKVTLYAPHHEGGVLLFSVDGYTSEEVGQRLDAEGICVRPGFHCSALGHKTLGTPAGGAVRVSFGWTSKRREAEAVWKVVKGM